MRFAVYILLFGFTFGSVSFTQAEEDRYISVAPSITEILFALGVGDQVVAISDYSKYPPEAQHLPSIGSLLSPNYEQILRLQPAHVVSIDHQRDIVAFCEKQNIPLTVVKNESLGDIIESLDIIGRLVGKSEEAESLAAPLRMVGDKPEPAIPALLVIGRSEPGSSVVQQVFAAAKGTFYDELMGQAGLRNVIQQSTPAYMQMSREGMLSLKPKLIIELIAPSHQHDVKRIEKAWETSFIKPFLPDAIYIPLVTDYGVIPGPRLRFLLEDFKSIYEDHAP